MLLNDSLYEDKYKIQMIIFLHHVLFYHDYYDNIINSRRIEERTCNLCLVKRQRPSATSRNSDYRQLGFLKARQLAAS